MHIVEHHKEATGPKLIFVHGTPDRGKSFNAVVDLLPEYRIVTYDRRGYGKSLAAGASNLGFSTGANDLLEIIGEEPAIVVAQSAGSDISMRACTLAPEKILALGVWEPPMQPYMWWVGEDSWQNACWWAMFCDTEILGEMLNRSTIGDDRWESLPERTRELLRAEGAAVRADMVSQMKPFMDIDNFKTPFVIGTGHNPLDERWVEGARRVAERMNGDLFEVPHANHPAHISYPEVWAELVRRTVAKALA